VSTLVVSIGHAKGMSFRMKRATDFVDLERVEGNVLVGRVTDWSRVGVLASVGDGARFFVLEPGDRENEVALGPFFVLKENNARRAREAWRAFEPL